jgi:hypothetical protein
MDPMWIIPIAGLSMLLLGLILMLLDRPEKTDKQP